MKSKRYNYHNDPDIRWMYFFEAGKDGITATDLFMITELAEMRNISYSGVYDRPPEADSNRKNRKYIWVGVKANARRMGAFITEITSFTGNKKKWYAALVAARKKGGADSWQRPNGQVIQ